MVICESPTPGTEGLPGATGEGLALPVLLLYLSVFDTQVFPRARRLGWLLIIAQLTGIFLYLGVHDRLLPFVIILIIDPLEFFSFYDS